ncbi:hypothetical protein N7478_000948 [Penicillium angulare]|uniref:uncharacterized protein n=1 Tax=Penicillium angulare TaxID=116970 RepID=UPI002540F8AA|nr:uncharacterized protein N7478_000948 [Penicillium angulare]KAJ5291697.1 hypothetical protein N7478_000948 [Penicillium angulare]
MAADNINPANPKGIVTAALPNMTTLQTTIDSTWMTQMLGQWEGSGVDSVQVFSMPVALIQQAIEPMAQVKIIGEAQREADRKKLIIEILTAVFAIVPFVGGLTADIVGLSELSTIIAIVSEISNSALGIYDIANDPSSALMVIIGSLLGLGGLGGAASRGERDIEQLGQLRRGMSTAVVSQLGAVFSSQTNSIVQKALTGRKIAAEKGGKFYTNPFVAPVIPKLWITQPLQISLTMPTTKYFSQCPIFPSNVSTASLPKVSVEALRSRSETEGQILFEACQKWGFFLLDLRNSEKGNELLEITEHMFELTDETFNLGQTVLDDYAYKPPQDLTGYKRRGQLKTDDGKLDRMELYSISQDDILGNHAGRKNADPIEARRGEVRQFIENSHSAIGISPVPEKKIKTDSHFIADIILSSLDKQLGLEPGTLNGLSPLDQPSETSVRLLFSQSQSNSQCDDITLGGHTDIGTITLLFNVVGGLQILPAGLENKLENWLYVKPEPGHALVNIGDTLVEWTGGLLRSSLHRVLTAPGEQALVGRQSVAYLVRPRNSASMQRLKGGSIPPVEEGQEDETRSVNEWASWRTKQIILGQLKPQTRGGKSVVVK